MPDSSIGHGSDRIVLRDLRVTAVVGVLPQERTNPQPLSFDVEIHTDLTSAGMTDRLEDSVDYGAVCDRVITVASSGAPLLLERLAHLVVEDILASFSAVDAIVIEVRKLRPPVPHDLGSSAVRIMRRRTGG